MNKPHSVSAPPAPDLHSPEEDWTAWKLRVLRELAEIDRLTARLNRRRRTDTPASPPAARNPR